MSQNFGPTGLFPDIHVETDSSQLQSPEQQIAKQALEAEIERQRHEASVSSRYIIAFAENVGEVMGWADIAMLVYCDSAATQSIDISRYRMRIRASLNQNQRQGKAMAEKLYSSGLLLQTGLKQRWLDDSQSWSTDVQRVYRCIIKDGYQPAPYEEARTHKDKITWDAPPLLSIDEDLDASVAAPSYVLGKNPRQPSAENPTHTRKAASEIKPARIDSHGQWARDIRSTAGQVVRKLDDRAAILGTHHPTDYLSDGLDRVRVTKIRPDLSSKSLLEKLRDTGLASSNDDGYINVRDAVMMHVVAAHESIFMHPDERVRLLAVKLVERVLHNYQSAER